MCKCSVKIRRDAAPSFVIQGEDVTPLDNKYAVVQFNSQTDVNYKGHKRKFQSTEVISLPYPLIYDLITRPTPVVSFRSNTEHMTFNEVYGL